MKKVVRTYQVNAHSNHIATASNNAFSLSESAVAHSLCRIDRYSSEPNTKAMGISPPY